MEFIEPVGLEVDDTTQTLFIAWSDRHTSAHALAHLRWLCPCAECKGEWGAPGKLTHTHALTAAQTALADVQPVGRYGLMPIWDDGHRTGIYTYEYLRANCECAACQAGRTPAPAGG
ncbi:MAG TPA: DUF971 domain-containing protein [Chloroflexia bacterium]|nr:DUF971 domain-containing protein [Chloroflexia bacterium]